MKLFILMIFLLPNLAFAFTLISDPPIKFASNEVTINVSNNDCDQSGYSASEILDMVEQAVDRFWNSVPTSALELKRGGVTTDDLNNATATQTAQAAAGGTILVACSTNGFDEWTGGKGTILTHNGEVKGGLILNNLTADKLSNMTENQRLALIAHEIGHAIGLSHSSYKLALMYYTLDGRVQESLTYDDADGVTYLYPNKKMKTACGVVDFSDNSFPGIMLMNISLGFLLMLILGMFKTTSRKILMSVVKESC